MKKLHISDITAAPKTQQVVENMQALAYIGQLTPEVFEQIELILANKPSPISDYR